MRVGQRKKQTVQLWDSDHNQDIGFTHDGRNQGWDTRTDLEGREQSYEVSSKGNGPVGIISERAFTVDGSHMAELADYAKLPAPFHRGEPGTYIRRTTLLIPTIIKQDVSVRRTAQLMHISEAEVKRHRRVIRQCLGNRDFTRDYAGRFQKT